MATDTEWRTHVDITLRSMDDLLRSHDTAIGRMDERLKAIEEWLLAARSDQRQVKWILISVAVAEAVQLMWPHIAKVFGG
ncbi:MAG: hypothetical protein ACYCU5_14310 [Actinomycetes bacterium]